MVDVNPGASVQTYTPQLGTHIDNAVHTALTIARQHGDDVTFTFNGVTLIVAADVALGTAPFVDYHKVWNDQMAANAAAYHASPEGIRAAQEAADRLADCNRKNAALVASLPGILACGDNATILRWLCDLESASHIESPVGYPALAAQFTAAGYLAGVNTSTDFRATDSDNFARYIIGQCVDMMAGGMPPHGVIHGFVEKWNKVEGK